MRRRGTAITTVLLVVVALLLIVNLATGQATPQNPGPLQTTVVLTPVADAGIESAAPDTNFGHVDTLSVYYGGQNEIGRALIRFNLAAALPPEAVIDSAYLELFLEYGTGPEPVDLIAANLLEDWVESEVTWNNQPPWGNPS